MHNFTDIIKDLVDLRHVVEEVEPEVVEATEAPLVNVGAIELPKIPIELPKLEMVDSSFFNSIWFLILLLCCFI